MLKVGSPQPQDIQSTPMNNNLIGVDAQMGDEMMDDSMEEMPTMNGSDDIEQNQFDTNFDAGVDADENEDPKKYIQQLTGKLSQTLRNYNENLPQPDVDLNKYVAGMINKQATNGLNDNDIKEIMDKLNSDEEMSIDDNSEDLAKNESIDRRQKIDELFQQLTTNDEKANDIQDKPIKDISFRKKPFTSPVFN